LWVIVPPLPALALEEADDEEDDVFVAVAVVAVVVVVVSILSEILVILFDCCRNDTANSILFSTSQAIPGVKAPIRDDVEMQDTENCV
jgi:hypothetical protein